MSAYDTQITAAPADDRTLAEVFADYGKAVDKFLAVFTAVVDQNIEANQLIAETVGLQKDALLK